MDANDHLVEPPIHEPDELRLSREGEGPPDLLLCLARSQKERKERLISARKMMLLVVGAMMAAALAAATFFWLARTDSASWVGEPKDARVDTDSMSEPATANTIRPTAEAAAHVASAEMAAIGPVPKTTGAPDSVIQLGAFRNRAQAERAWMALSTRFTAVGKMDKLIVPFRGGIRLRAAARSPTEATQTCDTLKAAGENCFVPR